MSADRFRYIFGPVSSWRLGRSLGVDPLSTEAKTCNFDCVYCQLGKTARYEDVRRVFVPASAVIDEIKQLKDIRIDYITFSGRGETTLAANLGEMIDAVRGIRKEKIAVITNSTLLYREDVQNDLLKADAVLAKLDACSQESFEDINRAMGGTYFQDIVQGIMDFRKIYTGKLALQVMFVEANKAYAPEIADIARAVWPDEVELNTPLRPSAVPPLTPEEMRGLARHFAGLPVISVYSKDKEEVEPMDADETARRHGSV